MPPKVATVQLPREGSAAQISQNILGEEVNVVSAFHNISAEILKSNQDMDCDVLVCGDNKLAREQVIKIINSIGLKGGMLGC